MTSHCAHGGVCVFLVLLYDFVCVFSARCFCHCRVVLLWCCVPPSLPPSSCPSKPGILGVHGDGVALPPSFLFSPSPPSLTLRASSHIHLPVLCLCLSILWCDPRRHGLTKLDELRSVPSSSPSPSFFSDSASSSSSPSFIQSTSHGLPSPTHLPSTQLSFLFSLRSPPFSCAVCALDCSIDDASLSFHILLFCCVQTVYAYSS